MRTRRPVRKRRQSSAKYEGVVSRSQVVGTFGVGAIYELRSATKSGQVLNSIMIAGLDLWPEDSERIREPHLERALGVRYFLEPPADSGEGDSGPVSCIPAVRFPEWLVCNKCDRLGKTGFEFQEKGAGPKCRDNNCSGKGVPVRIVMACYCEEGETDTHPGHVEDFPWSWWAHRGKACAKPQLKLLNNGTSAGLAGLSVTCVSQECSSGDGRSLDGVFNPDQFSSLRCRGKRPWLLDSENCSRRVRSVMRGASNIYFPVTVSALSIPPNSSYLMQVVGKERMLMESFDKVETTVLVDMAKNANKGLAERFSDKQIEDALRVMATGEASGPDNEDDQRLAERTAIVEERTDQEKGSQFEVQRVEDAALPVALASVTEHLVLAHRIREVRVLRGFHRVASTYDADSYRAQCAPLSKERKDWLPAIEVRGEGIYFELDEDLIRDWESRQDVQTRYGLLQKNFARFLEQKGVSTDTSNYSARLVLTHTLCHLVLNQLSLDCGYSTSSLRERLYIGESGTDRFAGFLIYTASPGADGTLGGLVRQGEPDLFEKTLKAALSSASWCSSDPLCIESEGQGTDALNLAACHACCIASETSCEQRNQFLDRGLVIGTPDCPDVGFFVGSGLL
jgi:hypothetical protein